MKNSAGRGGCYPPRPKAERVLASVDDTLRDLQNSSYPTKAEFNNCFIIHTIQGVFCVHLSIFFSRLGVKLSSNCR